MAWRTSNIVGAIFLTPSAQKLPSESGSPLSIVAGLGIIVMGAHFLGLFRVNAMLREARLEIEKPPGLWSAYLMGVAFAFGWTPCIGPILAAIFAVAAAQQTVGQGALLLAAYSLGLGAPFVVAAIAMERFLAFSRGFRRQFARLEKATGALLVVTGVLFLTGGTQTAAQWLIDTFPWLGQLGLGGAGVPLRAPNIGSAKKKPAGSRRASTFLKHP